jgi:hypothetical protein
MGKLLKSIISTPDDIDQIDGVANKIAELRQKLPTEAFGSDTILDLTNENTIRQITQDAKKMLIGRLLSTGGKNED